MDEKSSQQALYIPVVEAAGLLGLHPASIRRGVRAKRIPCKKFLIGKREFVRIPMAWILTMTAGGVA
jgi:hypothetical protein